MEEGIPIYGPNGLPVMVVNDAGGFGGVGLPPVAPFSVNSFAFPQLASYPEAPQISNINGIYDNLRWYLITNFWQVLSQGFCEIGLFQTIVKIPVDDALRGGCDILTSELSDDEIQRLLNHLEERLVWTALKETGYWDRLFGGSFTMPMVDDQDPEQPFDLSLIGPKSNLEFRAGDLWELFWDYSQTMGYNQGEPLGQWDFEYFSYRGHQVHSSRVWKMTGIKAPSYIRPRLRGWGLSVIEDLIREMNRFLKTQDVLYEILDQAKIDVMKFEGLIDSLFGPGAAQGAVGPMTKNNVARRASFANGRKNYFHTVVMDAKDDYIIRQPSFSGFSDIAKENRTELACALRIPQTKLWGDAPGGLSTTDENGIENYNGMIESEIRPTLKRNLTWMVKACCQELFGFVPTDLQINLKSLRQLSSTDEENIKTAKHNRLLAAWQAGAIGKKQYLEACNKDGLFPMKMENLKISPDDLPIESQGGGEGGEGGEGGAIPTKAGKGIKTGEK